MKNEQANGCAETTGKTCAGNCRNITGDALYPYPRVCAHRGFNSVAPENTMAAFGIAIALGAPEIELDVRFSKDGIPVVSHDDRLDRVSDGTGLVQDYTLEELRKLDFGGRFSPRFEGVRITTFEEVLQAYARQVIINLHIKSGGKEYPAENFMKIIDLLKRYDQMEHVYIMAEVSVMKRALELAPEIPRCMSSAPDHWKIVDRAIEYKCSKIQIWAPDYDQAMIDRAHENGIRCNVFYSDKPEEARKMFEMGMDTILTNDYLSIANVLNDMKNGK